MTCCQEFQNGAHIGNLMKDREEKTKHLFSRARTIKHLFRVLKVTNNDSKWKDLAKIISIDADNLASSIIEYLEIESHDKKRIVLNKDGYTKAANGTLVSSKEVKKIKKLYRKIIDVTMPSAADVSTIIEALLNALLFYIFNSTPRIQLSKLCGACTVLYNYWAQAIKNNGDIFN